MSAGKELVKSKTFWIGVLMIAAAIYSVITGNEITPEQIIEFLAGLGLISLRHAIAKKP